LNRPPSSVGIPPRDVSLTLPLGSLIAPIAWTDARTTGAPRSSTTTPEIDPLGRDAPPGIPPILEPIEPVTTCADVDGAYIAAKTIKAPNVRTILLFIGISRSSCHVSFECSVQPLCDVSF